MSVEFHLLGDVGARAGGRELELGHARQWSVLVALLVEANRTVPSELLLDRVWGQTRPHRALSTLYSYVSRLRRALAAAGTEVTIGRRTGGYVITVDPAAIDLHHFRDLTALARSVPDPEALALFDEALALWRGRPFGGLNQPWLAEVRERLDRERLTAELDRNDIRLRRGDDLALLTALSELGARHPLDERLAGQHMLALYRSGRQQDALERFGRTRFSLASELGLDPGPALDQLHRRILNGDPELGPARTAITAAPPRADLPPLPVLFTGRKAELARLREAGSLIAVDGMAGVGKTALALALAHDLGPRHPDGRLFLDLHAHTAGRHARTASEVLGRLLIALGVPEDRLPADDADRAALWRERLHGRRVLVVLDNVEGGAQVRPLLPVPPGCLMLVTSRRRLTSLDGAALLTLESLPETDARQLFVSLLGDDRATASPAAVGEVVRLCGNLPLALRIAAARLRHRPQWSIEHLAARLADPRTRLAELEAEDHGVAAAFDLSYRTLNADQQRVFRLLGLAPLPDLGPAGVAQLSGLPAARAERLLGDLVDAHLVEEHTEGRYRCTELMRAYAAQLTQEGTEEAVGPRTPAARGTDALISQTLTLQRGPDLLSRTPSRTESVAAQRFPDTRRNLGRSGLR
ncbi:BTAD domain-containing putative transcriptional regulator [Lentzea sp. NPDC054927]